MAAPMRNVRVEYRLILRSLNILIQTRAFSLTSARMRGLALGVYEPAEKSSDIGLTKASEHFNKICSGKLVEQLKIAGKKIKKGKSRLFYDLHPDFPVVAVGCLGRRGIGYNEAEQVEEGRENIRTAISKAVLNLRDIGEGQVDVDPCGDPEAAAEGGNLSLFAYDDLKASEKKKLKVLLSCYSDHISDRNSVEEQWKRGCILAEGQNFARTLQETPANYMTPTIFAEKAAKQLTATGKCTVTARNKEWMESQKMGAFLSVSQGSVQPPVLLEIDYKGNEADDKTIALVGKGVTFDSGGISLKPSAGMDQMRADMGGGACVVGTILSAAKLGLPVNIKGLIGLCENMPSGSATKPGDVVTAMNGKTIQVDNTDAEGRLVLADVLSYAEKFSPELILDMATLTGAVGVALGTAVAATYTNSTAMWEKLEKAGSYSGDRVWRMPLFNHYSQQVTESDLADVNNIGKHPRDGGSCTAAAFLKEFVTNKQWIHLDIAAVTQNADEIPYLGKGTTGRPTRTIVEFLKKLRV
ncbi:hypothetical protein ScPMuIL_007173 [Solemya velum]